MSILHMRPSKRSAATIRMVALYIVLACWGITPIVLGIIHRDAEWSTLCLWVGGVTLVGIGAGAWLESWTTSLFSALLIAAGGLFAAGVTLMNEMVAGMGVLGLIISGCSIALIWLVGDRAPQPAQPDNAQMQLLATMLDRLHHNSMLSDNAKRVLFRDRELQLLRQAIEEDIAHGDYNAGLTLCDEMANLFGQREEAESLRNRILQASHSMIESRVHEALGQFEHALEMRDWGAAHREAASMKRLFPTHHSVQDLDQRIIAARDQFKHELESQFLAAADGQDVALAMSLLKQLDRYLTRDEAARLSQSAQRVVMTHRENLSSAFKQAVGDRRWHQAAQVGEIIIREHPNTKMADEVRAMMDTIRARAAQSQIPAS